MSRPPKKNRDKPPAPPAETAFETRAIHAGLDFTADTGAVIPSVYLTSTFCAGNPRGFDYTRSGNPSFTNLETTPGVESLVRFSVGIEHIDDLIANLEQALAGAPRHV